jgi:hypothetical protein
MALAGQTKRFIRSAVVSPAAAAEVITDLELIEDVLAGETADLDVASVTTVDLSVSGEFTLADSTVFTATGAEINNVADRSANVVTETSASLTVTEALHHNKIIVLDRAGGIAVTLPAAAAGLRFRFIVKTTFTGAASIKSVAGTDIMIGHALMGNNTDNTVVDWPAVAADTFDTIDLLGTSNSTGGMAGQEIEIIGLAAALWFVTIRGDAAGTEATPFANTVA